MQRTRLYNLRLSRLPKLIGACATDLPTICNAVNTAQRRLVFAKEAGEDGWFGGFAEMVFNVNPANPYITLPREVARLISISRCSTIIPIHNQFYEYLQFGNGRLSSCLSGNSCIGGAYMRNNVVSSVDMVGTGQRIRVYPTDAADGQRRILIQGTGTNGAIIYSQDVAHRVEGEFLVLAAPFNTTAAMFNSITGFQKDITAGPVQVYQVDPVTGVEILLLTMEAGETTAWYRRYYLPTLQCNGTGTVQVSALVKLEIIDVKVDTDYTLIQNMEAIIEEAQSMRYSEIDSSEAKAMAQEKHMQAIRMLQGECRHYYGKNNAAVSFAPFGKARLEERMVGTMT